MNELDRVILDQFNRIRSITGDPLDVLAEAQGEILSVATPELTLEIIGDDSRTHPDSETRTLTGQIRAFQDARSIGSRALEGIRTANWLARQGMLAPMQGYVGGIISEHRDQIVYGHSTTGGIKPSDVLQAAVGDTFYPPMMWVKALRAATYEKRPESARTLSVAEYMAKLGLTLGSMVGKYGDLLGATGFMPGERLLNEWYSPLVRANVDSETTPAFRLSGLCDQAVVDPSILTETPQFAEQIIRLGGSLN